MTTSTADQTSSDALLSQIEQARREIQKPYDSMCDPLDVPGSWTERQKQHDRERRIQLPRYVNWCATLSEQVTKAAATRDSLTPARDRLLAAKASIEREVEDASNLSAIVDRREQTREWARQNMLRASLTAIERGVERFNNGQFALPVPLRELLTDTCATCGHATVDWPGPLPELEKQIAKAEAVIASAPETLARIHESVAPWLAEMS